ncbi:MAG: hypothetical protein ACYDGR_17425 [Candidatus Dormibacteria bacterium]
MGARKVKPGRVAEVDRDQLRRNLSLTPTERVAKMVDLRESLNQVRGLAIPENRRVETLRAIDAVAKAPARSA